MMFQYIPTRCPCSFSSSTVRFLNPCKSSCIAISRRRDHNIKFSSSGSDGHVSGLSSSKFSTLPLLDCSRRSGCGAVRAKKEFDSKRGRGQRVSSDDEDDDSEDGLWDEEERREWRRKIREVLDSNPQAEEELDPEERKKRLEKLLAEYPLVVEEEDPDWPEDAADGWGFNLGRFFDKISIKNVRRDDEENYDSDNELVWQDDDYIRPIKDITTAEWEETVFKDISPLVVLVHNRYRRPRENETCRNELEKAVNIIWNCRLPSPRCVAIDAIVECDLVSSLQVSSFPELIFTKAGKILYREKAPRSAEELSKIMAFYYYGAAKPTFFNIEKNGEEAIPPAPVSSEGAADPYGNGC